MEGRTGVPVSGTPPFPAPVPPPHGTAPAPAAAAAASGSDSAVLSPVFADLPGGPNGAATRTSSAAVAAAAAAASSAVANPGHANYQGKLFSSSVAALGAGSGFSYLGNYISPSNTDSFKQSSGVLAQPGSMNQYWLSNSEGYPGYSASGAHSYPPYLTTLNSLPGPGTQGLLAVSATAKSESQRVPASHHIRSSDLWEGPPSKLSKTSPHGLKEGALSPKTPAHLPAKSRHTSGSEDRKASKHDSSRSKNKDRVPNSTPVEEKKESATSRCGKTSSKEKGNSCDNATKTEQKLETDSRQDLLTKKSDKLSDLKQLVARHSGTLTIEINGGEEVPNSASKCNGEGGVLSPKRESSRGTPSSLAQSPKSKELSSEKRRKASKRKDLPVDVNGNAVLSGFPAVTEKKIVPPTATVVVCISENVTPVASLASETLNASNSAHLPAGAESTTKDQPVPMDASTNGNNRIPTSDAVPLTASPLSSVTVPSSGKPSPRSLSCKVPSPASAPVLSTSPGCSSRGSNGSAAVSPPGRAAGGVISVQTSSPGVIMSTSSSGDCTPRSSAPGDSPPAAADVRMINSPADIPSVNSSDISHTKACPIGASPATSSVPTSSPLRAYSSVANPTDVNPKGVNTTGINASGMHPSGASPKGTIPIGANPTRDSLTRGSPTRLGTFSPDGRTSEANPTGANPTGSNPAGLSPTGTKAPRSSPSTSGSLSSPHSVISSDLSRESPVEKEKLPSPRSLVATAAFSTCVTSSVSKPISFPAHGSLPSPSSQTQPSYISHLPIYLHGTGHLSLEREVGREAPRDGSKVHATTFVPALGEFIPGPASSATVQVKEPKAKTSTNGKESNHGPPAGDKEKDKASLKKEPAAKTGTMLATKEHTVPLPRADTGAEKTKVGSSHQDCAAKNKDSLETKSTLTKTKGEKSDKHEKSKKGHSSSKASHESRDHHLSPSELSAGGKDRTTEGSHRTPGDSIHRETCRTSDAAIISTTPSVHGYPHHVAGFSLPLGSLVPSPRDGNKLDAPPALYSTEEQRRYLEWHLAAAKRGYCYEHPGNRASSSEPPKLDPGMMHRTSHQPSFPSPRTDGRPDGRPEPLPEHGRGRDYPSYTAPQESMLRSVLTAGMHQAHSEAQRTSPGSSSSGGGGTGGKAAKHSSEAKTENRSKSASHGSKTSADSLGSQGRSTPGTKGSDGRNPPVGIAVAQKRQDSDSVSQGRPSTLATPRNSPHVGSDEPEERGARSRAIHGVDRDSKHREHSPRSHREATDLLPPTKYHHHRYPGDLGSNLIVTGGTSLGPSPHHFDPTEGRMTPSHPAHLALPPPWLPRAPGPPHAPSLWLGHPFGLATPPTAPLHATAGEGASGHLQVPPAGLQVARDPATGHLVLVPAVHSDSSIPPNLSMWPYLVPPHLQPHSHQLQQLVLNQPSFAQPLPHQASHPLTHRPDQPLPNADYHFALQQHQEALAQWYRQDEQRQREEQRRREQQPRKSGGEKTPGDGKGHKLGPAGETKSESHAEKPPASHSHDVLNLKIPPHAPYLPGVPLPGQPPVSYVYPPQQVQYLYNHAGVFPAPAVSCGSSPRTESGASTASPKQTTTKSSTSSDGNRNTRVENSLKTALKSISVQTSPSETPANVNEKTETKPATSGEPEENEEVDISQRTEESEDQELIIVDVVSDDAGDNQLLESEKINRENNNSSTQASSETGPAAVDTKPVEDSRTNVTVVDPRPSALSSALLPSTEFQSDVNLDPVMTQKMISETVIPIAPLTTPPLDTEVPARDAAPAPSQEEPAKDSLISNILTTTQSFASRMEALDQDQLAAIEGIALLSEVAEQKVFSVCNDTDKSNAVQGSQTRDDSYLLDARHQDNGTPLQGNTASALTSAGGNTLQLISQSCPASPTDFIFKRSTSSDGVDGFASPGDILNPNEVEMTQRLAELQRKYQEKKRELDKLQRKKDKNPIIKSSTAVLLEAAASLEESSPFLVPKKKKKKDREDKEKAKAEDRKKSSKKDKEAKAGHSESSKSKKRKHKSKDDVQESSPTSEDVSSSSSGGKSKSKSKSKSKTSPSLSPPSKDTNKQRASSKLRKVSLTDSASSDSLAKAGKSPKTSGSIRSPRSHNSSTEFDTDSSSVIWPSAFTPSPASASSKTPASKSKSKSSKKKAKDAKVKDGKKDGVKGQGSSDPADDATMEAIENVIRKSCDGPGSSDKEPARIGTLQRALHIYEDDSDSPWETAMIDAKQKKNSGHAQQKGLALLAGISSQELLRTSRPVKESKTSSGKEAGEGKPESSKKKSAKAKKRSISPATSDQGTPKKTRKMSPVIFKKEKDFESPSKLPKTTKTVRRKEKTPSEPTPRSTPVAKQERKEPEEKPFFNEEIWTRRRSERIFLSDISPGPSRDASPLAKGHDVAKTPKKASGPPAKPRTQTDSGSGEQGAGSDHGSTANIGSVLDALKTDTLQIRKKLASMSAQEDEKDDVPRKTKKKLSKKRDQGKKSSSRQDGRTDSGWSKHNDDDTLDSSCSEAENLPLSNFLDRQNPPPPPRSCIISKDELQNGLRVLTPIDGLFYAGNVNAIQPPDVYGVILDGERGNRPHVFSQEQMLQETFVDVKPLSTRFVPEGTRVCAYWSQQFRCLYPGTVVKGTPNPNEDPHFVCVEFDDGDSGRIPVDHIRMLPQDFPIVEFEPIPAELQRKRRRRTSDTSCSTNYKLEKGDTQEGPLASKAKTSSPKKKTKTTESSKSAADQHEMDRISESGEDDVFLPQTQRVPSKSKKSKSHDKSKKSSSKVDSKLKEKKKKKKRKREERRQESGDRKSSKRSSSKSPRRSPARSPSRSPGKSKKKKRKEDRKKKSSSKLSASNGDSSPKSKSSKKKSSSSSSKRKSHRDDRHSSFCTVETETVYSTHPINGSQVLTDAESTSETPTFDSVKGVWNKHRDTRDHSLDDWSTTDNSKDSSSDSDETTSESLSSKDNTPLTPSHKSRSSILPSTSKMTAFLPARQLWNWFGKATQRRGAKGKARKVFYRAIMRENEIIRQGDAAVFLSTGRPHLPYIGRIESMWESWGGNMVVRVKWFYHPEETKGGRKSHDGKMALYQSLHVDENDVQTISHKCEVLSVDEYKRYASGKKHKYAAADSEDVYYLAGTYDPTSGHITSVT